GGVRPGGLLVRALQAAEARGQTGRRDVMRKFVGLAVLLIGAAPAVAQSPEERARAFVAALVKEDYDGAVKSYAEVMAKALPADKLGTTWKAVVGKFGAYQKELGARAERVGEYQPVTLTCQFEKAKLDLRVVIDKDGKVAGLNFKPAEGPADFP